MNGSAIRMHPVTLALCVLLLFSPFLRVAGGKTNWPAGQWQTARPQKLGMDSRLLEKARAYAQTADGSGCIVRRGVLVLSWGNQNRRYDLKSSTKAIGVTALGLALQDGKIKSLHEPAGRYHPEFGIVPGSAPNTEQLGKVTLLHLVTQTAGFDKNGGYTGLLFEPGTKWSYSDGGPNWLAECVTLVYKRDLNELMFERVFGPIGISRSALTWRDNAYRPKQINGVARREFGSGISANVQAMARIGYLYLRRGRWKDKQIIPSWFVDMVRVVPKDVRGMPVIRSRTYFDASNHYGLLWWDNADGSMRKVPRDAYWSWGLYDSLILVIPSLDVVATRAGKSLNKARDADYGAIEPFIEPIALSVKDAPQNGIPPYPPSPVISGIDWARAGSIVRLADGSDNWPITWADDGKMYTAYGDGWGFSPRAEHKLSLGFAQITGGPGDLYAVNVRSESGERVGQGAAGAKASGMLSVDGVLYMLVRNVNNSQVAWSSDHGKTWKWCDWKFTDSFGAPTFLNFGRDYAGSRDNFVYIYSHDSDSAYEPADRMVLARVPKTRIRQRDAYEFFKGLDAAGKPMWTADIRDRGAVFINPGKCYRSGISYNAGLKRYLWSQTLYGRKDMRHEGGIGVFDAPEPWGPWTTVFYADKWDVGPGETSSFPPKWMSRDGKTCHLVFSGKDAFSIRKATLATR